MADRATPDKSQQRDDPSPLVGALHIFALFTLAVVHPLYEVLGQEQHANFFAAHKAQAADIWALVVSLSLLAPVAIVAGLWLTRLVSRSIALMAYIAVVGLLFAAILFQLSARFLPEADALGVLAALAAAIALTVAYVKKSWVRSCVTCMAAVVVVSPLLFLTRAPISALLAPEQPVTYRTVPGDHELPPVVVIVFDELPLISLLNEDREIDAVRFPNFAGLARTSTWYREASTVSYLTRDALPAILTGSDFYEYLKRINVDPEGEPDAGEFPANLLSLLDASHEVIAIESMTRFAPEHPATFRYVLPLHRRIPGLLTDTLLIAAHIVSPSLVRDRLPPLFGRWSDFLGEPPAMEPATREWPYNGKETEKIKHFIEMVKPRTTPGLYFLHVLLPHNPYRYNERGQQHLIKAPFEGDARKISEANVWPSEQHADRAYQAHLLQLAFTDSLLGRILDALSEADVFESALLVVTADHGISFYWDSAGLPAHELAKTQASEVMYVPLFIKAPHQRSGTLSDRLFQLIDIVPTVADMLDVDIPWQMDGLSAISGTAPAEGRTGRFPTRVEFGRIIDPEHRALRRKLALFGSGDIERVYAMGPHREIIGLPVTSFPSQETGGVARIQDSDRYGNVVLTRSFLPAYIEGYIEGYAGGSATADLTLAIAVNGEIRAVTGVSEEEGKLHFLSRVPPRSFQPGHNSITIHGVVDGGEDLSLVNFTGK